MAGRTTSKFAVTKVRLNEERTQVTQVDTRADTVAGEEPLEIRVDGQTLTTTMRTPGHDVELAHGFLHSEGHIQAARDIESAKYCEGTTRDGVNTYNLLDIETVSYTHLTLPTIYSV